MVSYYKCSIKNGLNINFSLKDSFDRMISLPWVSNTAEQMLQKSNTTVNLTISKGLSYLLYYFPAKLLRLP